MKKPIIAVDVDDVLGNENEAIRLYVNTIYGLHHTAEDYNVVAPYGGYWEKIWQVDPATAEQYYKTFLNSAYKRNLEPIDSAIQAITKLRKSYHLAIVTSRGEDFVDMTRAWLANHFPDTFASQDVHFVPLWNDSEEVTKAKICTEIGASYLIDDNAEHCNLAAEAGVQALLFGDYGWNRKVRVSKGVVRTKDWQSVLEYFDEQG